MATPDRNQAYQLLLQYTASEHLIRHALAVEAVMRYFAQKHGHDPEKWGIIGLIHDLDYDRYPEQHCVKTKEILESTGWPEDWIRSVISHGWGICSDAEPEHFMEKVLFTIDELTGLVAASALIRPSKSIYDLEVTSVKKRWKSKGFAAGVNREIIEKGASMLQMDIDTIIAGTIEGMRAVAGDIGLAGNLNKQN
ncbi:MAG TPA: HDIG domain-containing protein [Bacteroidales bacterium]|nr:HDIG domain-containing protein [Bacteroidales bacterium]